MQAHHGWIVGDSGSGKTTLLREIHDNTPAISIVVNHADESDFAGYDARSYQGMKTAVGKYDDFQSVRINYRSADKDVEGMLEVATEFAVDMWDTLHDKANTYRGVQICVPEAEGAVPDDDRTADEQVGKWLLQRGRDKAIKLVIESQLAHKWDYGPLAQCVTRTWCGPPAGEHEGFLRYHSWIPREKLPDEHHEYVVFNKRGEVLSRGTTKEKYGSTY